ncbi:2,3-diaminopropionate biosynthesis protein SbnB [Paenibacillus sp. HB172176]|uniref:2,3-diaminopropionate biosynthesis protein SbnB n=1 Tax=Paenibacillus sp. HB172176 TaxID=2493690 RepID=UPI00143BEC47|nr:2,3-diaminopropionate biosynthesis protein SbnB [Paenibacillus sp. HB172176]
MLYLGEEHIRSIGYPWEALIEQLAATLRSMEQGQFSQPLKPYLRYGDETNRIIAMPAYVGGDVHAAGLKWIASFPGNLARGLPRAHSVTILNDADTGEPLAIVNTQLVSAARTAAVSGLLLRTALASRPVLATADLRVGIIGWGPIGRMHGFMCRELLGERLSGIAVYDIRGLRQTDLAAAEQAAVSWQELYETCDIVITCTVSENRYIDLPPARGQILLDVSLRDYKLDAIKDIKAVIVDDWVEVCRENTDIELLHRQNGLTREGTLSLSEAALRNALAEFPEDEPLLFCPMGMAVFDVAIASWYASKAKSLGIGAILA